ncbi:MAG: RRXRR domain-containing protein [Acidobacteria bacterium]|nr:RRXRR domain-containing protein [Acidobacteriota bacterium]
MQHTTEHEIFVLSHEGEPLTPTTRAKARKLLSGGVAHRAWSKFGTFGIQLLVPTRKAIPVGTLGGDCGTKYEGYSVVIGHENVLNVKLDLPDKKPIVKKKAEQKRLRRARRYRNCRRRPQRFQNRKRNNFIAPSQLVIVGSRLKVLNELCRIYPITYAGWENVQFNHAKHRWGANFSTVEIGKRRIRQFFADRNIYVQEFAGYQTKALREKFGYPKSSDKAADIFSAHCSDSLTLALAVHYNQPIPRGPMVIVDDTYRPVRRKLHDTQFNKHGKREGYSRGTVFGLRKGLLIGTKRGRGRLCGKDRNSFLYRDENGKRQAARRLLWVSSQFITRPETACQRTRTNSAVA